MRAIAVDHRSAGLDEVDVEIDSGQFLNIRDAAELRDVYEELQAQLPAMLASPELHELESRLEPAALERRLAWMKQAMSQPQGLMLKNVPAKSTAGISDTVSARLRVLQAGDGDAHLVARRITSADGLHVLINAVPTFRPSELGTAPRSWTKS